MEMLNTAARVRKGYIHIKRQCALGKSSHAMDWIGNHPTLKFSLSCESLQTHLIKDLPFAGIK